MNEALDVIRKYLGTPSTNPNRRMNFGRERQFANNPEYLHALRVRFHMMLGKDGIPRHTKEVIEVKRCEDEVVLLRFPVDSSQVFSWRAKPGYSIEEGYFVTTSRPAEIWINPLTSEGYI